MGQNKTALIVILVTFVGVFAAFRWLGVLEGRERLKTVEGLLRSEYLNADSYALSKALTDLEDLGLIHCVLLIEYLDNPRVFYNTVKSKKCYDGVLGDFLRTEGEFQAINGLNYKLTYQRPIEWETLTLELFCYIFSTVIITAYFNRINNERLGHSLRLKALELEREFLEGHARQIRHDVASPLTAFKTIISAAKGMDESVKSILMKAVNRTEQIFQQLEANVESISNDIEAINVDDLIFELVKEKRSIWRENVDLHYSRREFPPAFGNAITFQRIVSNILNNAYEAIDIDQKGQIGICCDMQEIYITISIKDNGRGIPDEIKQKIGTKGFSFGKELSKVSGAGLGLYSAKEFIRSWGGEFYIESTFGKGTTIFLKLRIA